MTEDPGPRQDWIAQAVATHQKPLVLYALKLTGRLELAREIVQDTFLKLCQQPSGAVEGHLAPWLYTVCRNRALDVLRKEKPMKPLIEPDRQVSAASADDPLAGLSQRETHAALAQAIQSLPVNQREVVRLKFQHGLSYRDIAQVTQLSPGNVGYLLHVAVKSLRQTLAVEAG